MFIGSNALESLEKKLREEATIERMRQLQKDYGQELEAELLD